MRRICFISGDLEGGAGMERSLTSLANRYAELGHDVSILKLFKSGSFFDLNNKIRVIMPSADRNKYNRFIYAIIIVPYMRRSIRILKPEVLISFGEWFNSYVILATRFLNIPLYISDRMSPNMHMGFLLETARKLTYQYATGIIAQTNLAAEILRRKTRAKNIKVIPNPVNIINTDVTIKKKQIVTVGRLSREKGHIFLMKAFAKLRHEEWTLHIIGDGIQRNNLEVEAERIGIKDRIFFYGQLKDFSNILGQSEVFVLPSLYEGFPNALLEAMSVPLACISSNCNAGPSEIIEDGVNGLLVPPGDVEQLVIALNKVILNEQLRHNLSVNAIKVRGKYDFNEIANQYMSFLLSLRNKL